MRVLVSLLVALCVLLAATTPASAGKIKNVVYLMMENRSFDHMLGFMKAQNPAIRGLTGHESCPWNTSDPSGRRITVTKNAPYSQPDPCHSIPGTTLQVFGADTATRRPGYIPPMDGFVESGIETLGSDDAHTVMDCFHPSAVPAITTLASEYAVFDDWYASVPGPTEINRMYAASGTSHGAGYNKDPQLILGYPQKPIYQQLDENKISWNIYQQEVSSALYFQYNRKWSQLQRIHKWEDFHADAKAGTLPRFSWLEPCYFSLPGYPATDQHPSHDVSLGDQLIKEVYEAVRNSPQWNETLLIITYDEHGGFFDHVPTPLVGVPNPDGLNCTNPPFGFDRLGVRIPTVMVSPWIKKGHVEHEPPAQAKPFATSRYEHTSMLATLRHIFNITSAGPLTKRDEWAATFHHLWENTELRSEKDCVPSVKAAPVLSPELDLYGKLNGQQPLSGLNKDWISLAAALNGFNFRGEGMVNEAQGGEFVRRMVQKFIDLSREKAQKA